MLKRQFHHTKKAWYGPHTAYLKPGMIDEVVIGLYDEAGNAPNGELAFRWKESNGRIRYELTIKPETWVILKEFIDDLFSIINAYGDEIGPQKFCELLKGTDFDDATQTEYTESWYMGDGNGAIDSLVGHRSWMATLIPKEVLMPREAA